jgi:hypothetical protein
VSSYLTRGNEVPVVNRVKRPAHNADSSAGAFDRHEGLVVSGFARAATRVAMCDIAVRENNNRENDEPERENASPDDRREDERRKFFRGADDSVHNVLPQKAVSARLLAPLAISAHNPLRARQFAQSHRSARV